MPTIELLDPRGALRVIEHVRGDGEVAWFSAGERERQFRRELAQDAGSQTSRNFGGAILARVNDQDFRLRANAPYIPDHFPHGFFFIFGNHYHRKIGAGF